MSVEADWFLRAHPDITTIEALLPDCNGIMRGKWLPRHKLAKVYQGEFKLPLTARIESRISSADRRRMFCRQNRLFSGSFAKAWSLARDDIW